MRPPLTTQTPENPKDQGSNDSWGLGLLFFSERSEAEGRALFVARELGWKRKKMDKKNKYDDGGRQPILYPLFQMFLANIKSPKQIGE
jgi:hypothetical protein